MPGHRLIAFSIAALAAILPAGCATHATRPGGEVQLSLTATPAAGSPSAPVALDIQVENGRRKPVLHCSGCGCGNGIQFEVRGPDGAVVNLLDPNRPVPLCADGARALMPGHRLAERWTFTGTLYVSGTTTSPSPTYDAPAGTYTATARFAHSQGPMMDDWDIVEQTSTFVWRP